MCVCVFMCVCVGSEEGIPEFWLTALKNVDLFSDYIMVSVAVMKSGCLCVV